MHRFSGLERPALVGPNPGDHVLGSEALIQSSSHKISKQTISLPSSGCISLIDIKGINYYVIIYWHFLSIMIFDKSIDYFNSCHICFSFINSFSIFTNVFLFLTYIFNIIKTTNYLRLLVIH